MVRSCELDRRPLSLTSVPPALITEVAVLSGTVVARPPAKKAGCSRRLLWNNCRAPPDGSEIPLTTQVSLIKGKGMTPPLKTLTETETDDLLARTAKVLADLSVSTEELSLLSRELRAALTSARQHFENTKHLTLEPSTARAKVNQSKQILDVISTDIMRMESALSSVDRRLIERRDEEAASLKRERYNAAAEQRDDAIAILRGEKCSSNYSQVQYGKKI